MARDPEAVAHLEWLGYVQPVGLVVSVPALLAAQARVNRNVVPIHTKFLACLPTGPDDEPIPELRDFGEFTRQVLEWRDSDLEQVIPGDPKYAALEVYLREYEETLRPTWVVRELEPKEPDHPWMMLVQQHPAGTQFDKLSTVGGTHWQATSQAKFERLLRETKVPLGLLVSPTLIRMVYAPRGESSGYMTFSVPDMAKVAGRPILAALHMLLCEERLFSVGEKQRLPAVLADSRKYQNHVSNELSQQVLAALYELLRGFQAAHDASNGELLKDVLVSTPNHVYHGLLTVLMRLVFLLYAEDRGLISSDPVYGNYYSVTGLFERLRSDAGRYPDTMDQRYGAWAQLLTLFRLIYDGGSHGNLHVPARSGYLFDPDRYNFLEGRPWQAARRNQAGRAAMPRIADGVICRVLENLLVLDGERLSYRTLDVEQIGSVYETMMGFEIEVAGGQSIAIKPKKRHGAPTTINLDALLATKPGERGKWLKEQADQELTGKVAAALKEADTVEALLAALDKKIAKNVTPNTVSKGSMVFQPSDERRRSGSHYTPRSLTEPIVRTTLRPILEQLGENPKPEQILALKVCDPAMGSGAFLVEACRQLGDVLLSAWHFHRCLPAIPPDEDEVLHARRLIAQRCLYGVDKNPMAVDLSKLALWLATLAKDHPFTFLDHSLRCGDSLVGLTREQIAAFHWDLSKTGQTRRDRVSELSILQSRIDRATELRRKILSGGDEMLPTMKSQLLANADEALSVARLVGDVCIAAFFSEGLAKKRQLKRDELFGAIGDWVRSEFHVGKRESIASAAATLRRGEQPIEPFHWEIEFPEVFSNDKSSERFGFDSIIGNPPFVGVKLLGETAREHYTDLLRQQFPETGGKCDLVAFFFRQAYLCLRSTGTLGFIATKTIGQGDTRRSGLAFLIRAGATIYSARKRLQWPGQAAVIVSVVHAMKSINCTQCILDGKVVDRISSYLLDSAYDADPEQLDASTGFGFLGSKLLGMGFIFDDEDPDCPPVSLMDSVIRSSPDSSKLIKPFVGGEQINSVSRIDYQQSVIDFGDMAEDEARGHGELLDILSRYVLPQRLKGTGATRKLWWQYAHRATQLYDGIRQLKRFLVLAQYSQTFAFAFLRTGGVINSKLVGYTTDRMSRFAVLQSRVHESWARFFSGTLKDDLQYTPSACLVTFPFPVWDTVESILEQAGSRLYAQRESIMSVHDEGLTQVHHRFHDPEDHSAETEQFRQRFHDMDCAVLEAYGWHDLAASARCEFLLDYDADDDDDGDDDPTGRKRQKKKPWRYRWPDEFRDEVLARLLDLNQKRAEEERLAGAAAKAGQGKSAAKTTRKLTPKKSAAGSSDLFADHEEDA